MQWIMIQTNSFIIDDV